MDAPLIGTMSPPGSLSTFHPCVAGEVKTVAVMVYVHIMFWEEVRRVGAVTDPKSLQRGPDPAFDFVDSSRICLSRAART